MVKVGKLKGKLKVGKMMGAGAAMTGATAMATAAW
jgi:hypothetical protein